MCSIRATRVSHNALSSAAGFPGWITSDYKTPVFVAGFLDGVSSGVHGYEAITQDAVDPYIALRDAFTSHRAAEIKK